MRVGASNDVADHPGVEHQEDREREARVVSPKEKVVIKREMGRLRMVALLQRDHFLRPIIQK